MPATLIPVDGFGTLDTTGTTNVPVYGGYIYIQREEWAGVSGSSYHLDGLIFYSATNEPALSVRGVVYREGAGSPSTLHGSTDVLTGIVAGNNYLYFPSRLQLSSTISTLWWLGVHVDGTLLWPSQDVEYGPWPHGYGFQRRSWNSFSSGPLSSMSGSTRITTRGLIVGANFPPTVGLTDVVPNTGPLVGGQLVTLNGTDFAAGATVTFDGVPATEITVLNAAALTCRTPAHVSGAVSVVVTLGAQTATLASGYTYTQPTILWIGDAQAPNAPEDVYSALHVASYAGHDWICTTLSLGGGEDPAPSPFNLWETTGPWVHSGSAGALRFKRNEQYIANGDYNRYGAGWAYFNAPSTDFWMRGWMYVVPPFRGDPAYGLDFLDFWTDDSDTINLYIDATGHLALDARNPANFYLHQQQAVSTGVLPTNSLTRWDIHYVTDDGTNHGRFQVYIDGTLFLDYTHVERFRNPSPASLDYGIGWVSFSPTSYDENANIVYLSDWIAQTSDTRGTEYKPFSEFSYTLTSSTFSVPVSEFSNMLTSSTFSSEATTVAVADPVSEFSFVLTSSTFSSEATSVAAPLPQFSITPAKGCTRGGTLVTILFGRTYAESLTLVTASSFAATFPSQAHLLTAINVVPANALIPPGGTQQYAAMGVYSDGAVEDITPLVSWASSDPAVAVIDSEGLATTPVVACVIEGAITEASPTAISGVGHDGGMSAEYFELTGAGEVLLSVRGPNDAEFPAPSTARDPDTCLHLFSDPVYGWELRANDDNDEAEFGYGYWSMIRYTLEAGTRYVVMVTSYRYTNAKFPFTLRAYPCEGFSLKPIPKPVLNTKPAYAFANTEIGYDGYGIGSPNYTQYDWTFWDAPLTEVFVDGVAVPIVGSVVAPMTLPFMIVGNSYQLYVEGGTPAHNITMRGADTIVSLDNPPRIDTAEVVPDGAGFKLAVHGAGLSKWGGFLNTVYLEYIKTAGGAVQPPVMSLITHTDTLVEAAISSLDNPLAEILRWNLNMDPLNNTGVQFSYALGMEWLQSHAQFPFVGSYVFVDDRSGTETHARFEIEADSSVYTVDYGGVPQVNGVDIPVLDVAPTVNPPDIYAIFHFGRCDAFVKRNLLPIQSIKVPLDKNIGGTKVLGVILSPPQVTGAVTNNVVPPTESLSGVNLDIAPDLTIFVSADGQYKTPLSVQSWTDPLADVSAEGLERFFVLTFEQNNLGGYYRVKNTLYSASRPAWATAGALIWVDYHPAP